MTTRMDRLPNHYSLTMQQALRAHGMVPATDLNCRANRRVRKLSTVFYHSEPLLDNALPQPL